MISPPWMYLVCCLCRQPRSNSKTVLSSVNMLCDSYSHVCLVHTLWKDLCWSAYTYIIMSWINDVISVTAPHALLACTRKVAQTDTQCSSPQHFQCVQEDWQMRRNAVETFITLAAAVQVSMHPLPATDHCPESLAWLALSCSHRASVQTKAGWHCSQCMLRGQCTCPMINLHVVCMGMPRSLGPCGAEHVQESFMGLYFVSNPNITCPRMIDAGMEPPKSPAQLCIYVMAEAQHGSLPPSFHHGWHM